jgi:hypothetical protein
MIAAHSTREYFFVVPGGTRAEDGQQLLPVCFGNHPQ